MYCTYCGTAIAEGTRFCTACGKPVDATGDAQGADGRPSPAQDASYETTQTFETYATSQNDSSNGSRRGKPSAFAIYTLVLVTLTLIIIGALILTQQGGRSAPQAPMQQQSQSQSPQAAGQAAASGSGASTAPESATATSATATSAAAEPAAAAPAAAKSATPEPTPEERVLKSLDGWWSPASYSVQQQRGCVYFHDGILENFSINGEHRNTVNLQPSDLERYDQGLSDALADLGPGYYISRLGGFLGDRAPDIIYEASPGATNYYAGGSIIVRSRSEEHTSEWALGSLAALGL